MYAGSGTIGKVSGWRRGILFLLVLAMTAALFGTVLAAPADAASNYKVKAWSEGDMRCYMVYQGTPQYDEPTFCRYGSDVYTSGSMKISFLWPWDDADGDKAYALSLYLGEQTQKSWQSGCYWISQNDGYYTEYWWYVYMIEGWYGGQDDLLKLQKQAPFVNSNGDKLYIEYIGRGDVTSEKWSVIKDVYKCSSAMYWSNVDATIGFRFTDKYGNAIEKYCP